MSMTDPISDLLTRIRNGGTSSKKNVLSPYSKVKEGITKVLLEEGFIRSYTICDDVAGTYGKHLNIELKYYRDKPSIYSLRRISKPSLRIYRNKDKLNEFAKDGYSVSIISTPEGVMSYQQATRKKLGGEILCVVS